MKKEPEGDPLGVFLAYYDSYLRRTGLTDAEFAQMISESEWTIRQVRDECIEAPKSMLDKIGWCKFKDSYYKRILVEEVRYMPKKEAIKDDE